MWCGRRCNVRLERESLILANVDTANWMVMLYFQELFVVNWFKQNVCVCVCVCVCMCVIITNI